MSANTTMGLMARVSGPVERESPVQAGLSHGPNAHGHFSFENNTPHGMERQEPHFSSTTVSDLTATLPLESWQVLNRAAGTFAIDANSSASAAYGFAGKLIPHPANSDRPVRAKAS
jgi:hypothetical protein